jgi:hypothetical protein
MVAGFSHSVSAEVSPESLDYVYRLMQEWAPWDAPLPAK